jgi:O-acetyl-ADP-ribose deacetylase (regulator of RNase III)
MNFVKGNILDSDAQALVNTVNTVGVMGKGIALQFKERFPDNFKLYRKACNEGVVQVGKMFVTRDRDLNGEKIIINFPTKKEWYKKSQYTYIDEGLKDLANVIQNMKIRSVAIPPLGCGNGGLNWEKIKELIEKHLGNLVGVELFVFVPNPGVKKILQSQGVKREPKLTPARAMLLFSLFRYEKFGEYASLFVANKLAYFLQLTGEPLRLKFKSHFFGPYSNEVGKVLYTLNGKYLTGMEQYEAKPFATLSLNYDVYPEIEEYIQKNLNFEQKERLGKLFEVIKGYETALSLEVLSSVDYFRRNRPGLNNEELTRLIQDQSDRKQKIINKEYVDLAVNHLTDYSHKLEFA